MERFGGCLSTVHVHVEEVDGVVHGVKRIYVVRTVVNVVIDAAQHQTFQQGTEQILVRVRPSARGNGIDLAVDGTHRILGRCLLEGFDVRHLHGRVQGGLLYEEDGIDEGDLVVGVYPSGDECERVLAEYQLYLEFDAVDQ